jgi:anaerobilin synthase
MQHTMEPAAPAGRPEPEPPRSDGTFGGKLGLFRTALSEDSPRDFFAREGVDPLTRAFDRKVAVHAGFGGHPVPDADRSLLLETLLSKPRRRDSAIYIHVPFCESHCLYCGFYNRAYRTEDSARYTETLLREMEYWAEKPAARSGPVRAVYLGGGTPTALKAPDLKRILRTARDMFPLANDCEITVEGRIHHFGPEKMDACLEGGANRFSIGVQTFHAELRRAMNRIEDREATLEALARLRDDGRAAVVIDLIFGFPDQTPEMWMRDLEDFLALEIDGADLYQLNVFKGSPLDKAIAAGKSAPAANLPEQAGFFEAGMERLERARYRRLSMSHWGRTTRERNTYNHLMKGPSECLAFGPGAGGCLDGHYFFVENRYEKWIASVNAGEKPISVLAAPHPLALLDKTIAAGFDIGRVDMKGIASKFRIPLEPLLSPLTEQWWRAGLVNLEDGWMEPTPAGQFWHVNLAQFAIEYLHRRLDEKEAP